MTVKKVLPIQADGKSTPNSKEQKETAAAKTTLKKVVEPSKEDLLKQVKTLEEQLKQSPQSLDEKIAFYNKKKDLIRKHALLTKSHDQLEEHLSKLAELSASDDFQTDDYILTLKYGGKYNKDPFFELDNPVIVGDVIQYILKMIEERKTNISKEIEE